MFEQILFILLGAGAVVTAAMVVLPKTGRNPLYGAIALVLSFFFMAGIYVLLLAHTMAVLQILVYAGAIMVLFMFVIMLLNLSDEDLGHERRPPMLALGVGAVVFLTVRLGMTVRDHADGVGEVDPTTPAMAGFGNIELIGDTMFRDFLFTFELASILLLVAVVGATVLAKRTL